MAAIFLSLCIPMQAQESMELITQDKGWALEKSRELFWTNDNGAHWTDISPPAGEAISTVFFLDASHGWALLTDEAAHARVSLRVATTTDSGQTWSISPLKVPSQEPDQLDGRGWLDFVDALHGWVVLPCKSSSAISWALLLVTNDGGKSWGELPQAPIAGRPVFVTKEDGWISGSAGGGGIFRTRDGGKSWRAAGPTLQDLPTSLPTRAGYGDVRFTDPLHGFLTVVLTEASDTENLRGTALLLYFTEDGGETWKIDRTLADRSFAKSGAPLARFGPVGLALTPAGEMILITTFRENHSGRLTLKIVARDGKAASSSSENFLREHEWPVGLSFITSAQGWLRTSDGRLCGTENGGATWKDISPLRAALVPAMARASDAGSAHFTTTNLGAGPSFIPQSSSVGLHYSERLGFDEHNVPSIATMGTWWDSSPFFTIGIYIGGANYCGQKVGNTCVSRPDPGLTSSWVTQAEGQGWGFLPIWIGPQAPCNSSTSLSKFSTDIATAESQGKTEAVNAASAMAALGLSGTVVFYDMENYSTTAGSTCSLAVRAFLNGWVSSMNAKGFSTTAVYGNPGPAQNDFSQVPGLTQVWITATPGTNLPPRVTIWGLGTLSDASWNDGQRAHQFLINIGSASSFWVTYGTVNTGQPIDYDMGYLLVAGATGAKKYIWTGRVVSIANTALGVAGGLLTGINDVITATSPTFIQDGQMGQMAGYSESPVGSSTCAARYLSACYYSFIDDKGTFSWLSLPAGATYSYAFALGLNDSSTVIGFDCTDISFACEANAGGVVSGFLWTPTTQAVTLVTKPCPTQGSTGWTELVAINDNGQAVGEVCDDFTNPWFIYYKSAVNYLSLTPCPGMLTNCGYYDACGINGIDGYGNLVGSYDDSSTGATHGFIYHTQPPNLASPCLEINVPGAEGTQLLGTNNQGQLLGYYIAGGTEYPFVLDNGYVYSLPVFSNAINDAAQLAGGVSGQGYVLNPE